MSPMGSRLIFSNDSIASTACGRKPSSLTRGALADGAVASEATGDASEAVGRAVGGEGRVGDNVVGVVAVCSAAVAAVVPDFAPLAGSSGTEDLGRYRSAGPLP